jgi:hypothetical protein
MRTRSQILGDIEDTKAWARKAMGAMDAHDSGQAHEEMKRLEKELAQRDAKERLGKMSSGPPYQG